MIDGQDDKIMGLYFALVDFFNEEQDLYNKYAKKDDYNSYITGYNIAF